MFVSQGFPIPLTTEDGVRVSTSYDRRVHIGGKTEKVLPLSTVIEKIKISDAAIGITRLTVPV